MYPQFYYMITHKKTNLKLENSLRQCLNNIGVSDLNLVLRLDDETVDTPVIGHKLDFSIKKHSTLVLWREFVS